MVVKKHSWVNLIKLFGILSVVLGHIATPLTTFIYSWHMPLFFCISGFFIQPSINLKSAKKNIYKEFNRLMLPYFFFCFLALVIEAIKRFLLGRDSLDYYFEIKAVFFDMDINGLSNHYGFVLWFLPALLIAKSLYYFLTALINNKDWVLFLIVLVLFKVSFFIKIPFGIQVGMNALFWVFLGGVCYRCIIKYDNSIQFIISLFLITTLFLALNKIPILDMAHLKYENVYLNVMWAISIIMILAISAKKICSFDKFNSSNLNWLSDFVMFIFIIHPYTNNIAHLIVTRFFQGDWWFVKFLMSLFILAILISFRNKLPRKGMFNYV